jgi:hypothetical protein
METSVRADSPAKLEREEVEAEAVRLLGIHAGDGLD